MSSCEKQKDRRRFSFLKAFQFSHSSLSLSPLTGRLTLLLTYDNKCNRKDSDTMLIVALVCVLGAIILVCGVIVVYYLYTNRRRAKFASFGTSQSA